MATTGWRVTSLSLLLTAACSGVLGLEEDRVFDDDAYTRAERGEAPLPDGSGGDAPDEGDGGASVGGETATGGASDGGTSPGGGGGGATGGGGTAMGGASSGGTASGGGGAANGGGGTSSTGGVGTGKPQVVVNGTLSGNVTWNNRNDYILDGTVLVTGSLDIDAGTTILGRRSPTNPGRLVVARGGSLEAVGTDTLPIVFTSEAPAGAGEAGDWAGVALLGSAAVDGGPDAGPVAGVAAPSGLYGGSDEFSSCGHLQGVRIEFAGARVDGDTSSALVLGACGGNTVVQDVMITHVEDDCIELLGGAYQVHRLVCDAFGDDGVDTAAGFTGTIWRALLRHSSTTGGASSHAIEVDGPSRPRLREVTACGAGQDLGALYRRDAMGELNEVHLGGFGTAFNVVDPYSNDIVLTGDVDLFEIQAVAPAEGNPGDDDGFDEIAWFAACSTCSDGAGPFTAAQCLATGGPTTSVTGSGLGAFRFGGGWLNAAFVDWSPD